MVKIMTTTRTPLTALAGVALAVTLLTGCSSPTAAPTTAPTAASTVSTETDAPNEAAVVAAVPAPAADPRLEVTIAGVVYTGTDKAPLKIGTDTPGAPPAAEASLPAELPAAMDAAEGASKYMVNIGPRYAQPGGQGGVVGYSWAIYGLNAYGNYKALADEGVTNTAEQFATAQEALDAPKILEGRALDRAEYLLRNNG